MRWRRLSYRAIRPLYHAWSRLARGGTIGVRAIVLNEAGEVLLVEHTYMAGWYLPGGGVERGETVEAALARELEEEAGVRPVDRPTLLGVYANHRAFPGDHVALFRVDRWEACRPTSVGEIRERAWFPLDRLPAATTRATLHRLAEALGHRSPSPHW